MDIDLLGTGFISAGNVRTSYVCPVQRPGVQRPVCSVSSVQGFSVQRSVSSGESGGTCKSCNGKYCYCILPTYKTLPLGYNEVVYSLLIESEKRTGPTQTKRTR